MNLQLTLAMFAALTSAIVLLRIFWWRIPRPLRTALIVCACLFPILEVLSRATGWATTSGRMNCAIYWGAIASYQFFVLLFTLLRPFWLTSLVAVILIVPLLSANVFLPLTGLLVSGDSTTETLGHRLFCDHTAWYSDSEPTRVAGVDLSIQYRPSFLPFLRRERQKDRLYNSQCNAAATVVTLQPGGERVLIHCPPLAGDPPSHSVHVVVDLY